MPISMYQASVPIFVRHLNGLVTILKKAQALYAEKKYDESTLLSYRLYPDMYSFTKQVQAATDHAMNCAALLAGLEAPKYEDNEKSLAELIARVEKTIAYLSTVKPEQVDASEGKIVTVKMRDREMKLTGLELLQNRSMPNFYFHSTTAYDIIRHNGVEIGKRDFQGLS
ncbi:MAG: hypothetical protein A3H27_05995 [Acidobacteria bacterium RIFCSPLOWO2_02_FULL_59_13]|nr:MAG: hypothetical protein A3H27_05995 [Acidobacteria bacterium RIFCSPLOWO2_02_FULL_59_13]